MNTEITYTTVDTDALDFLKVIYFGVITNPYEAASKRAYLDMNRTIRFNGMPEKKELNSVPPSLLYLKKKSVYYHRNSSQARRNMILGIMPDVQKSVLFTVRLASSSIMVSPRNG